MIIRTVFDTIDIKHRFRSSDMAKKRTSTALIKAKSQLASARKRATALRRRYNQPPIMRVVSIAGGGAAAGLVDVYSPYKEIAGVPVSALAGVAFVAGGSFMRGGQSELLINLGAGMLACAAKDITKNQLSIMGA